MTQMKNWQAIYALTLILIVGSAWAEEKKPSKPTGPVAIMTWTQEEKPSKATCPKCCAATKAASCKECYQETCSSCSSPKSAKLVTRIHSLAPFFEALEQLEEEESAVSAPAYAGRSKAKLEEQIVKLITNHVQPASWNHMGGQGTVDYFALGKALVVTQKAETHEQIARFLDDLRSLVDDVMAADEEEQEQCLPPRAFAGMPMPSYCPAPVDLPIERIMIERVMAQPAYPYAPAQCVYPCPPMPFPPMTAPPAPPMMDALQARMPAPEVLPAPRPVTMAMPVPVAQCAAMQPAQCQGVGCVMRAKCEGGKTQLELENCCMGMRAVCESMELKTAGPDALKLTAQQSQIHMEGHGFRAVADCLKCTGGSDWMLEGHVMLSYKKEGSSAQVRGDRVVLSLKDGQMEFKFAGNSAAMPSPIHPAMYSAPLNSPTGWVP